MSILAYMELDSWTPLANLLSACGDLLTSLYTFANGLYSSFRNLSPRTRMTVGLGFLAWGTIGLYLSDSAEKKFGMEPTEKDKAALPRIITVERDNDKA
ncbi:hypothetical protein BP6252_13481 [Coleophoma cylindrospora]|uniref:Uncharacterized protein n=1 Tax=Coleophoma cylindrospora TaxID=1849047 RepID=A0A3D8Q8R8_9HELO|nr:hypothetical protein BP6252_13481 [Coleophoma cylindrospora]